MNLIADIAILLTSFTFLVTAENNNCCPGNNTLTEAGRCYNGTKVKITFPECEYKIMLGKDQFAIAQNGSLIELAGFDEFIPQNRFCIAMLETTRENVSVVCLLSTDQEDDGNLFLMKTICCLVSVIFLLITIIVYILVPKLRDLQGKCILISMIGLTAAFISLTVVQLHASFERPTCLFWAFTVYFTFLIAFFWLNIVAINMWRKTIIPTLFNKTDHFWFTLYIAYGVGGPIAFLISAIVTHNVDGDHIKPGFGDGACFLNAPLSLWSYFYGPIAVLLIINLVLFIWSSIVLWMDFHEQSPRIQGLKFKCLLTLKLCLIMGVPWLFEVLSFSLDNIHRHLDILWIVTDFVNTLQGVLIFLVLVLFRKKALRGLASNPTIGNRFPKSWQRLDDGECSTTQEILTETKLEGSI